jgi:hypothetical protein
MLPPIRSSLADQITCPRCLRHQGSAIEAESFRALIVCYRRDCGQHFWVMWLLSGPVEPQLAAVFDELAPELMKTWKLPPSIDAPKLWQLSLSRNEYDAHRYGGSRRMLKAFLDLVHLPAPS